MRPRELKNFTGIGFSGSFQNPNNNIGGAANVGGDIARNVCHELSFANGTFAEANSKLENGGVNTVTTSYDMSHNSILSGGIGSSESQS